MCHPLGPKPAIPATEDPHQEVGSTGHVWEGLSTRCLVHNWPSFGPAHSHRTMALRVLWWGMKVLQAQSFHPMTDDRTSGWGPLLEVRTYSASLLSAEATEKALALEEGTDAPYGKDGSALESSPLLHHGQSFPQDDPSSGLGAIAHTAETPLLSLPLRQANCWVREWELHYFRFNFESTYMY